MEPNATRPHDVSVQEVEYLRHAGEGLLARMYLPQGPGPFPLVCQVHGGAWCRGSRLDEDRLNRELARLGVVVAAVDFRMPPQAAYPASLADLHAAMRWLKLHARQWNAHPSGVGLMGVSSGAHQAMLLAMRPTDPRYAALPVDGAAHDARAAFVVLCWPVIDPLGRYRYALDLQRSGQPYPEAIDRVIPDHLRYWKDEASMDEGSPLRILARGEPVDTPPVFYLQGDQDLVHPRAHLDSFVLAYRAAGGPLTLQLIEGEAEGFIHKKPDAPASLAAIEDIAHFVQAQVRGVGLPSPLMKG